MIKAELVDAVAKRANITKKEAGQAVDALVSSVSETLARGEKVQLVGFGTFEVRQRQARAGRNPQTGDPITIAARKTPVFRAGKTLREAVE